MASAFPRLACGQIPITKQFLLLPLLLFLSHSQPLDNIRRMKSIRV